MRKRAGVRYAVLSMLSLAVCSASSLAATDASIVPVAEAFQKIVHGRTRMDLTTTDSTPKPDHVTIEFDTLERVHLISDAGDLILLPDSTWTKQGASWTKQPGVMLPMVKQMLPFGESELAQAKHVADVGKITWNGQSVYAYTFDSSSLESGMRTDGHFKVYLDAAGRIVGSESDIERAKQKSHVVQKIAYDDSIAVKAPQ